jgi:hypothetical protein
MLRTTVPETSVNEHRQSSVSKNKVGLPENASMSSPSLDSIAAQQVKQCLFGSSIPITPNASHDVRPF